MLTIRAMAGGEGYAERHLQQSDYYDQKRTVEGQWHGRGAELLGLSGKVTSEDFESLRQGLDPKTGKFLRQRQGSDRISVDGAEQSKARSLYDMTFSAPKSVSVMAIVGGDERLIAAHETAVCETLQEAERYSATRVRLAGLNENRTTGNWVVAAYTHDTSRELDPQLHTHAVAANLTYDGTEARWKALQASGLYERRSYLTEVYRNALAREVCALGYEIENRRDVAGKDKGFEIAGMSQEILDNYSRRSAQRDAAIEEFTQKRGRPPTDNEVAVLIRETRADKLQEISTEQVRCRQWERLTPDQRNMLGNLREQALTQSSPLRIEHLVAEVSLGHAQEHVFERLSVAKEHEILTEALRHGRGQVELSALQGILSRERTSGNLVGAGDEIATQASLLRERDMVAVVNRGLDRYDRLGDSRHFEPASQLRDEQRRAGVTDPGTGGISYCYSDTYKPQFAVRSDGSVFVAAMTNNGLPPLTLVQNGQGMMIDIPPSRMAKPDGTYFDVFSPTSPPMVNSDGSAYMEYEVRVTEHNPDKVTSAVLYLLKIAPDNSTTTITLSSTTEDKNLAPGRIIPDGRGGVLATWMILPTHPPLWDLLHPPTPETAPHPFQASHVTGGVAGTPYDLPFTPRTLPRFGEYLPLVLGESGVAFAVGPTTSLDGTNTDFSKLAAFDLNSGSVAWNYQVQANALTLSIIAATAGNGIVAKTTDSSGYDTIIRFSPSGAATLDSWTGYRAVSSFIDDKFVGNRINSGTTEMIVSHLPIGLGSSLYPYVDGNPARSSSALTLISEGAPIWGAWLFKKSNPCVLDGTKVSLAGQPLQKYTAERQKLLDGHYLTSGACSQFFAAANRSSYFGQLTNAVTRQIPFDGLSSGISLYDAGMYTESDSPDTIANLKKTPVKCAIADTNRDFKVAMAQIRPLGTATDVYIEGQNISALTQATVLHEALHNLTGLEDPDLKALVGLEPGGSDTSDINDVLVRSGCAGSD